VTGRAGPRIGYLNSLAARTAAESLRPPHRPFGPVFAEPPTAEAQDRADQPSRAEAPGRRQAADIGPGDPDHRGPRPGSVAASAQRAPDSAGRPSSAQAGRPDFGTQLPGGPAPTSAGAAAPRGQLPGPPRPGESGATRLAAGPPQAPGSVTPPQHQHGTAALPHATTTPPHGTAPPHATATPPDGAVSDRRTAPGPRPLDPAVGHEGLAGRLGTRQPFVISGQPYLSPPTPASAMAGHQTPSSVRAPKPAAGLSIGTIEVTVLPPPVAAAPRPAARPAAARPSRPQPPPRLTRGYGPGFGQGPG
jgi:hypothetical protein